MNIKKVVLGTVAYTTGTFTLAVAWHVLAFVAKQSVENVGLFVTVETVYLALQFGLFGILIGLTHSKTHSHL